MSDPKLIRILRLRQVIELTGYSRGSIYRLSKAGKFPKFVKLSEKAVGFRSDDIQSWIESRQYSEGANK